MPRVQRCPKHTRRKPRKTGKCIPYEPPYQTKYVRCPDGERKNDLGECVTFTTKEPAYRRCKKGFRKDANGDCKPFKNDFKEDTSKTLTIRSEDSGTLTDKKLSKPLSDKRKADALKEFNKARLKLKEIIKSDSVSDNSDSINSFLVFAIFSIVLNLL